MNSSKLIFTPINNTCDIVPTNTLEVALYLAKKGVVSVGEIDPKYCGGFELVEEYNIDPDAAIKCLIIEGKRNKTKKYAALLVPIKYECDVSEVKEVLNVKTISFAKLDYVLEQTNMELGSITPIGIPEDWYVFVDSMVFEQKYIIIGGGLKNSKLMLASELLKKLPNSFVLDNLAKEGVE